MSPVETNDQVDSIVERMDGAGTERGAKVTTLSVCTVVVAVVLAIAAVGVIVQLIRTTNESEAVHERYNECASASSQLMIASDYLTTECRMFVVTGDRRFMDGYFEELLVTKRRDAAVATLGEQVGDERATIELIEALGESNELAISEIYAMRLVCDAADIAPMPEPVAAVILEPQDAALSASKKRELAESMVLGEEYRHMKDLISANVNDCANELVLGLEASVFAIERLNDRLLLALAGIAFLLMILVATVTMANYVLVMRPMKIHERNLLAGEYFDVVGSVEIKRVAAAYNKLLAESRKRTEHLQHEAETDALTGAYNRGTYDRLLESMSGKSCALILADVDHFKEVNDQYGHEVGDEVLKRVAAAIMDRFRATDYVCRIGGDEFAVILTKIGPESQSAIEAKLAALAEDVAVDKEGLPHVTLSFGVAFSNAQGDANLYHEADRALYASKRTGRNRSTFSE